MNMETQKFKITNLTCEACIKLSTMALKKIPGVFEAIVDLKTGNAEIKSDRTIAWEEIVTALKTVDKTTVQTT